MNASCSCFAEWMPGDYPSHWWVYVSASAVIYAAVLVLTLLVELGWTLARHYDLVDSRRMQTVVQVCIKYVGERSRFAILLECLTLPLNGAYLCLYVVRTYYGIIASLDKSIIFAMVLAECVFVGLMLVPFTVRIFQAKRPVLACFSVFTIVDILTLPHPFVSLAFSCDWVGLRNLRFLSLAAVSKVLIQIRVINSPLLADAARLVVSFLAIWLTSAGMVYLLEVSGDPWDNFSNAQDVYFLEYVYFAMTTMTTVGYGDISPQTALGRVFVTFFMIAGLALFALALGPITDYLAADKKYYTYYSIDPTRPHIVVCGDVNPNRMHKILQDFLHPDRVSVLSRPDIVFLMKEFPLPETKLVIQKHFPHAFYLIGSMFKLQDLQRVQLSHAAACVIMTDTSLQDQEASDGTAIMRYIAVKNYSEQVRVIMQVSLASTSSKLEELPIWNPEKDLIFCINDWRLGWLSAACYSPGISTMLGNLICPVSLPRRLFFAKEPTLYMQGASLEIYCTELPEVLVSRQAKEAILVCRSVCELTLIAVEFDGQLKTNPVALEGPLQPGTLGYFIAENRTDLNALQSLTDVFVQNILRDSTTKISGSSDVWSRAPRQEEFELTSAGGGGGGQQSKSGSPSPGPAGSQRSSLPLDLQDHYVLCLFASPDSPPLNLAAFCKPLLQTLSDYLIVITDVEYAKKLSKTDAVQSFANIHIVVGSPLDLECLEQAQVSKCKYCALMTVSPDKDIEELALVDKQAILCLRLLEGMEHKNGGKVPFVVELLEEDNVQFVYLDDEDEGVEQVQLSTPYAWGSVVTMGMVDLLMATSFYNAQSTKIVRRLVKNPSVDKIPITDLPSHVSTFIDAFEHTLSGGNVCVGLMRMADENTGPTTYYPITAPKSFLQLEPSDLLLLLR